MTEPKFKVGDIVKVDLQIDWYIGYIVHAFMLDPISPRYNVCDFMDGKIQNALMESWIISYSEE
jgi:hypothetical protein